MGVVYMAEQKEPVKRRVALKIIKPGMDTRQVIARFEAERQALAMMDHPNIAKVLDAGATDSGRPYFVMELVNGISITQYCDEQHLTPKERLELFVPICQAVQHAHQKGIIHRDLKPSNVLVALYDDRPVPKVIDFGVAKATSQTLTEKTMFTQFGQIVGTLEYMSPEQAQRNQLDIDTRSDIYSLGVLLYELLTGDTPFDRQRLRSAAFDEMLRIIREEEPPKPSTKVSSSEALPSIAANRKIEPAKLSIRVRGELDWIVMKALEKDRGRRYETATSFAEDIQHYLNDEAVVACPPSARYRFRKFARRNKAALMTSTIIAGAMLLSVGSIGWSVRDQVARRERLASQVDLLLEDANRLISEKQWLPSLAMAKKAEAAIQNNNCDAATKRRVVDVVADMELVRQLKNTRMLESQFFDGKWNIVATSRAYAQVFVDHGFDIEHVTAGEAADQLHTHPQIVAELASALTHWSRLRREIVDKNERGDTTDVSWIHLLDVADKIDADPWRYRLRAAFRTEESKSNALHTLAESVNVETLPPSDVVILSRLLHKRSSKDAAADLLLRSHLQHPGDFEGSELCLGILPRRPETTR